MAYTHYRTRAAQLHAKIEASFTPPPGGADIFLGFKPTFKPAVEQNEDESLRASFGKPPSIAGGISADLGFSFNLKSTGAAPVIVAPEFDDAMKMCGMKPTVTPTTGPVTYNPDISQNSPGSASWNSGGQLMAVQGAFGNLKISGESGKLVVAEMAFKGAYVATSTTTLVSTAIALDASVPQALKGATVSVSGVSSAATIAVKSFAIDLGANISLIPDMSAASAYAGGFYGDRNIKGSLVMGAPLLSVLDMYAKMLASTVGVFSWAWGVGAGNIVTITVPTGYITSVTPSDNNGRLELAVEFQCALAAGASEGGDLSIAFS